jgi:hypothetical protein
MSKTTTSAAAGAALWSKMEKANAALFALTYGSLITELLRDFDTVEEIHAELEKMGHNIGLKSVDEILAKSEQQGIIIPPCTSLKDTAQVIAKTGFKMMLGINVDTVLSTDGNSFSLILNENPLALFVELPPEYKTLQYSILYCGVIRGALEQVNLKVKCTFVKDQLQGDETNEIHVQLEQVLQDGAGDDYKEE